MCLVTLTFDGISLSCLWEKCFVKSFPRLRLAVDASASPDTLPPPYEPCLQYEWGRRLGGRVDHPAPIHHDPEWFVTPRAPPPLSLHPNSMASTPFRGSHENWTRGRVEEICSRRVRPAVVARCSIALLMTRHEAIARLDALFVARHRSPHSLMSRSALRGLKYVDQSPRGPSLINHRSLCGLDRSIGKAVCGNLFFASGTGKRMA